MKYIIGIVAIALIQMVFTLFKYIVPSISPSVYSPYKLWLSSLIIFWMLLNKVGGFNI
jgi:hypothetical protein